MSSIEAYAAQKTNYWRFLGINTFLLVEGITDAAFVDKLNIRKTQCIPLGDVLDSNKCIKEAYKSFFTDNKINPNLVVPEAKNAVLNVVMSKIREGFKTFYGLVDKDFTDNKSKGNIFVTPTHDLETLLLSTTNIFTENENIKKSFEDSCHLAYLIGVVKRYLLSRYKLPKLKCNDYKQIIKITEKKIDLAELINKLRNNEKELSDFEKSRLKREIEQSNILCAGKVPEKYIYDIANGHDILNIMALLCEAEINALVRKHETDDHIHVKVELAVIEEYNIKSFKQSPLYSDMTKKLPINI